MNQLCPLLVPLRICDSTIAGARAITGTPILLKPVSSKGWTLSFLPITDGSCFNCNKLLARGQHFGRRIPHLHGNLIPYRWHNCNLVWPHITVSPLIIIVTFPCSLSLFYMSIWAWQHIHFQPFVSFLPSTVFVNVSYYIPMYDKGCLTNDTIHRPPSG